MLEAFEVPAKYVGHFIINAQVANTGLDDATTVSLRSVRVQTCLEGLAAKNWKTAAVF